MKYLQSTPSNQFTNQSLHRKNFLLLQPSHTKLLLKMRQQSMVLLKLAYRYPSYSRNITYNAPITISIIHMGWLQKFLHINNFISKTQAIIRSTSQVFENPLHSLLCSFLEFFMNMLTTSTTWTISDLILTILDMWFPMASKKCTFFMCLLGANKKVKIFLSRVIYVPKYYFDLLSPS